MVDICAQYGMYWDIKFNSAKSQRISFGGCQPPTFSVTLNEQVVQWVHKLKYLGCFFNQSCIIDYSNSVQKFYGNFNNILSVLGRSRNEITAVHLVNSYCIPSLLYGCEIWDFKSCDYHKVNVIWNNAFRKIFQCCWRESVTCLQYYCKVMPLSYIIDQRIILFHIKVRSCNNSVIQSLYAVNTSAAKIMSKYSLQSFRYSSHQIKAHMWKHFVDSSVMSGKLSVF